VILNPERVFFERAVRLIIIVIVVGELIVVVREELAVDMIGELMSLFDRFLVFLHFAVSSPVLALALCGGVL
jgi:hypothetical protein